LLDPLQIGGDHLKLQARASRVENQDIHHGAFLDRLGRIQDKPCHLSTATFYADFPKSNNCGVTEQTEDRVIRSFRNNPLTIFSSLVRLQK